MVDAVFAPLFRYFDVIDQAVSQPIFDDLNHVAGWRSALAARPSVVAAVGVDYAEQFFRHLRQHQAILSR